METRASLSRVREIHKYAKVLPHCSAPVRLNHLARCSPLAMRSDQQDTFQTLFYQLTDLALEHQRKQKPIPTNNFPKVLPRRKKRSSSFPQHNTAKPRVIPDVDSVPISANTLSTNVQSKVNLSRIHSGRDNPPDIVISRPSVPHDDHSKMTLSNLISETCDGDVRNLKISDICSVNPSHYLEILELLKQEAINLEVEIEKTVKIENPVEARNHVHHLEKSLIKVMPLMNLLTSLVKLHQLQEDHLRCNSNIETIVSKQRTSIEKLLIKIHQLESDVLNTNCSISKCVYDLVNQPISYL